jgi:uncharacterized protein (TIGR04255 family)
MVRDFPALHLKKSPLVYVLAQVLISPVLRMEDFVPDIQERLRQRGYVRFSKVQSQQLALSPEPSIQSFSRWIFSNRENTEAIVLSQDFITLETTQYDRFETFVASLEIALRMIGDIVKPALAERLGLRYVDLINPKENESFDNYLEQGVLGLSTEQLGVDNLSATYETTGSTPAGQLVLRLTQATNKSFLPPDLSSSRLNFTNFPQPDKSFALLDIDNYSTQQFDFAPSSLVAHMWQLHRYADRAFRSCVTDQARQLWQAQPVETTTSN